MLGPGDLFLVRQALRDSADRLRRQADDRADPVSAHLLRMAALRYDRAAAEAVAAEQTEHQVHELERKTQS